MFNTSSRYWYLPELADDRFDLLQNRLRNFPAAYEAYFAEWEVLEGLTSEGNDIVALNDASLLVWAGPGDMPDLVPGINPFRDWPALQSPNIGVVLERSIHPTPTDDQDWRARVAGYCICQMYNTVLALMTQRLVSFHQHGGRPADP